MPLGVSIMYDVDVGASAAGQSNPPWGLDRIDQRAFGDGPSAGEFPWEVSLRQAGGGAADIGGMHEFGHGLDTNEPAAPVTGRESVLIYSGESGGIDAGPFSAYDAGFRGGVSVAAGDVPDTGPDQSGRLLVGSDQGVFDHGVIDPPRETLFGFNG